MTDSIKFIIAELAKEPFRKKFTVISFDSLNPEVLLQILNDVIAEIEPSNKMDIREEAIEDTVVRIFNMLRVLKYKPPNDDPSVLRSGLAVGDKEIIHPMLTWLLPRVNELKTRAYLAAFLVKIEIPPEFRSELEVEGLYQQYEEMIEQFKSVHKQLETMRSKGFTTSEIRKDIEAMEIEQESVQRKIEKLKRNTESTPNTEELLTLIRTFRKEREHSKELGSQHISQTQGLNAAEQKVARLQRQLKEVRAANIGATAEGTLARLEQDKELTRFIVKEKLPKEIRIVKKQVELFTKIVYENIDEHDLEDRKVEVDTLKANVNELVKRKMMKTDDDNLILFRQQTSIVANKKLGLIEKLAEARNELEALKGAIGTKQEHLAKLTGDVKMNEDQFKEYVKTLRVKSTRFKQLKAQMAYYQLEVKLLSKTLDILQVDMRNTEMNLKATESRLGVLGFSQAQNTLEKVVEEKTALDETKTKSLQEMAVAVEELHKKLASKKNELSPIVKLLNSRRSQVQLLTHEYENQKKKYDATMGSTEAALSRITREVEALRARHDVEQLKYCKLGALVEKSKVELDRMKTELKLYAAASKQGVAAAVAGDAAGKRSYKDQITSKITEQERLGIKYKDEERELQNQQIDLEAQAQMWSNVQKLLECKCNLRKRIRNGSSNVGSGSNGGVG